MTTTRIAMAQIDVEGGNPEANVLRALRFVEQAAAQRCDVVVLPECMDLGWTHGSATTLAQSIPGVHTDRFAKAAQQHQIYIVVGLVERSGPRIYNAAVLIDPQGHILLHHRKINELEIATALYSTGDRLGVVQTQLGVVGINICADNFHDSLYIGHTLGHMGAQLLLSPCAWAVDAEHNNDVEPYGDFWRGPYGELAAAYNMTIVGVSNVGPITDGPWAGRNCIGCSLAIGPDGSDIVQGPYGKDAEALIVIEIPRASSIAFDPLLR